MHVLVTGAYGLIGSAIVARLRGDGHRVTGTGRDTSRAARSRPDVAWFSADFTRMDENDWSAHLAGVDAVVNCAGVLQGRGSHATRDVHLRGTVALFRACARAGVRRVIHFSAIGVEREQPSDFSRTKLEADRVLAGSDLEWVILRPSVVLGRAAFGGSALFRGLAGLPLVLPVWKSGDKLQVVQLDDVVETVARLLQPNAPSRVAFDLAGPERLSLPEIVAAYRHWLGLPKPRIIALPAPLARALFAVGDAATWLGWRPPLSSTAAKEFNRGAVGDNSEWMRQTGIVPRALSDALARDPASVQERWFARLYFLKPVILGILAAFWLSTGILALGPGYGHGEGLMKEGGVEGPLALLAIVGGGLLDILIGIGIAIRRTARLALWLSIATAGVYAVIGSVLVPRLWIDPLGPMLKIWPIIVFSFIALVLLEDR